MMPRVAVFAGLGSESLFSDTTLDRSAQDVSLPESQILLRSFHTIFRTQIALAIQRGQLAPESIDLDDFQRPDQIQSPPPQYRHNIVLQHTTIYLVQTFRYLRLASSSGTAAAASCVGAAGFCVGLFPAATVLTAHDDVEFLQRALDFFHVTLWLGIHCEAFRVSLLTEHGCAHDLPWSVIVDNVSQDIMDDLNVSEDTPVSIYASAQSSPTCYTLSGRGDQLAKYVSEKLPSHCRTRTTNVFTLYHNQNKLQDVHDKTMASLEGEMALRLNTQITLAAPLFSTVADAANITGAMSLRELIGLLLEMILYKRVDWLSTQRSILAHVLQQSGDGATSEPMEILNFGPGYGMSRSAVSAPKTVEIRDVSAFGVTVIGSGSGGDGDGCASSTGISPDDIAIVGMAVDLPDASNANELWENLRNGKNSVSEIPESRFFLDDFYQSKGQNGNKAKRSIKTRFGNFLRNPFLFDNDLFDISPREAKSMDPQQRVLLQTTYRALEDAGYVPDSTPSNARESFGCFIGNATLDYTDNLAGEIDVYYSPGTLRAFQSGRLSYYFGWSGTSLTLDTACSSSMVAMHQAVRSIHAGDCRAAVVGGANVISSPDMYLGLDRAHFLSPSGQCKAFDASADGYCRAEGCGIFVLKKVRDALAEGDRIHGIIKGIESNQSGNAHSITHPHSPTQEKLFKQLLKKSNIHPHQISLVETHGTGTQAGDPRELESLRNALCHRRDPRNTVYFTSIKANIGHAEAASGAASLAKVLLMMKHGAIPPQISLKNLNPKIKPLGTDGSVIDPNGAAWQRRQQSRGQQPRLALLHNVGAAGSNAALIIREYEQPQRAVVQHEDQEEMTYMLGISGKSAKVVAKLRDDLATHLTEAQESGFSVADICYTMTARRQLYAHRISVTGSSPEQLAQNLRGAAPVHTPQQKGADNQVVFVFSGQGSQYLGMGQQLLSMYPVFSQTVHKIDDTLRRNGFPSCLDIINASADENTKLEDTTQLQAFQSAIFALEVALARLLISWGVNPSAVIGHSLGEYAALVTAGVLDIVSGTLLVARRAQLLITECELATTSMLAVNMSASKIRSLLTEQGDRFAQLDVSCENSPGDCVVGGRISQLNGFKAYLHSTHATKSKFLEVPMAYHTRALDPILSGLKRYASSIRLNRPTIPVISTVLGRTVHVGEDVFTPEYFARHSRDTVYFQQGLASFLSIIPESSVTTHWIEVGPHASLLPMIKAQVPAQQAGLMPCLRKGVPPSATLSKLMSYLYDNALSVNWRQPFDYHDCPQFINLPGLPFFQSEFKVAYPTESVDRFANNAGNTQPSVSSDVFLGRAVQKATEANGFTGIYETPIQFLKEFITGHIVCGHALCPASVYHQMALSAVKEVDPSNSGDATRSLSDVEYVGPLLYTAQSTALVRIVVASSGRSGDNFTFEVSSHAETAADPSRGLIHCRGKVKTKSSKLVEQKHGRHKQVMGRQITRLSRNDDDPQAIIETFSTRAMYDNVFTRVVTYSKLYQLVQFIRISPDYGEAYARCRVPSTGSSALNASAAGVGQSAANSIFMDVLLHVAGFVANMSVSNTVACICKEVSSALVFREPTTSGAYFDVCCTLTTDSAEGHVIADAQASDENGFMASFKGMVFQQVQLAKITKAFEITSKRVPQTATANASSIGPRPSTSVVIRNPLPRTHSTETTTSTTPGIKDIPALEPSRPATSVRNVIAQTCGADLAALPVDASLEELGFDSLLLIELESQLSSSYPGLAVSNLAECVTVSDIERLCASQQTAETPTSPSSLAPVGNTTSVASVVVDLNQDVQRTIRLIIAETCSTDSSSIDSDSELVALGIDSLMIYELESNLAGLSKDKSLTTSKLSECRTVGDVEKLIIGYVEVPRHVAAPYSVTETSPSTQGDDLSSIPSSGVTTPPTEAGGIVPSVSPVFFEQSMLEKISKIFNLDRELEVIQRPAETDEDSPPAPLFLIHDGSGICTHYRRLRPLNRTVYALHDPKFLDPFSTWFDLGQMADHYANTIETVISGPLLVGGWSFGGVVAFEVARRLVARGHQVIGTVLIDSPAPWKHQPLSPAIIDAVLAGNGGKQPPPTETTRAVRYFMRLSFASCTRLLSQFRPRLSLRPGSGLAMHLHLHPHPLPLPSSVHTPRGRKLSMNSLPLGAFLLISRESWRHPTDPSFMEHMWLQDRTDVSESVTAWETVAGHSVPWMRIPGNHFEVFDPANIDAVTEAIRHAAGELETTFS